RLRSAAPLGVGCNCGLGSTASPPAQRSARSGKDCPRKKCNDNGKNPGDIESCLFFSNGCVVCQQ
ncbi:hypothetical protein, partial [Pelomonas sp. KK5]|uniref:hypothetical protein n=1 Tax=Pelomonas sp. KK5 TaxID=1855730 RepID=UPI001E39F784